MVSFAEIREKDNTGVENIPINFYLCIAFDRFHF